MMFDILEIIEIIDNETEVAKQLNPQMAMGMIRIRQLFLDADSKKESEMHKNNRA